MTNEEYVTRQQAQRKAIFDRVDYWNAEIKSENSVHDYLVSQDRHEAANRVSLNIININARLVRFCLENKAVLNAKDDKLVN